MHRRRFIAAGAGAMLAASWPGRAAAQGAAMVTDSAGGIGKRFIGAARLC
jgi:hypothetical protein